ncbi:GNAT family N-acetyltransferase [Candidatus Bathyarchaeota archaeon]|nr:GNAT family N-acetyltransferase [Candidatus Bathyarchaeota archaeon]
MKCKHCQNPATYKCTVCGALLCPQHTRLQTTCPTHTTKTTPIRYTITKATTDKEKSQIQKLVKQFWGEPQQLTFNKTYTITNLPTYIAKTRQNSIIGFITYTQTKNATLIIALAIHPQHQNKGIAKRLIAKIETEAKQQKKKRLLVSTSNDDLPALAFYQHLGFQTTQIKPNVIAQKHGTTLKGIGGLPIRDEIRLQKTIE